MAVGIPSFYPLCNQKLSAWSESSLFSISAPSPYHGMKVMQSTNLKTPVDSLYSEGIKGDPSREYEGVEGVGRAHATC